MRRLGQEWVVVALELVRGQVVQAAVGPHGVVVATPSLDDDGRFSARPEPFERQAFVSELAIEALVGTVLPGLAGVTQGRSDAGLRDPFKDGVADKLRPVVRAREQRCTMHADQSRQNIDDALRSNRACHVDRQAFPGVLVDDGQTFDVATFGKRIEDE